MKSTVLPISRAKTIVKDPPVKVKPAVDVALLLAIDPLVLEDSFVYVHCYFDNPTEGALIRIWNSTFLMDAGSTSKSKLVHTENISLAPQWTLIPDFTMYTFLLIFTSLPKACTQFDLIEQIPQPGGFHVKNIPRNQNDIYHITIH
jgi:hypothetical protein